MVTTKWSALFIGAVFLWSAAGFSTDASNTNDFEGLPGFSSLPEHEHKPLERQRIELAPGIYAFVGYSSSNFGVITSDNGYILIDTGDDVDGVQAAIEEISSLISGELQAIILTHSHPDHRSGGEIFLNGRNDIPVYGHAEFGDEAKAGKGLEKVLAHRFGKQFGIGIPDELYTPNFMLPRFPNGRSCSPISPNRGVEPPMSAMEIDGVTLEIHTIPGESADHLAIWLPGYKVLFAGDQVYGCFPNLYPIRGGAYRDVERWAASIRRLMEFDPDAVMFGHNDAPAKDDILPMMNNYASAIEHIYRETIAGMNEGKTPDELAVTIRLPDDLHRLPYLGEFYGAIPWAVRSIFAVKIGWFDGNPTTLIPLTPAEEAQRIASAMGGADKMVENAKTALEHRDYRWAAKLGDYLIQLGDVAGKDIKADALEGLSHEILPISGKNYLLRSAIDLRSE